MESLREISYGEWKSRSVPDVYFTYQYHDASSRLESDFSRIVLLEGTDHKGVVLLPLILRKIPNTSFFDATSAYGYGGPWTEGDPNLTTFRDRFDEWATSNKVVSTFLRYHPLLNNAETFRDFLPSRRIGPTAGWSLNQDRDLIEGMSKGHRKSYRRALRAGVEARITVAPDQTEDFRALYRESMDRLSAAEFYKFSDDYWRSMEDSLGESTLLVEAVWKDRVVAAVWCLVNDNYLHYHLSGTSAEGRNLGAAVLCRVAAAEWGRDNKLVLAHFGGGVGGDDSPLLNWKRRFDEKLPFFDFHVANIVHQEILYSQLCSGHTDKDFFPPWRSPTSRQQ